MTSLTREQIHEFTQAHQIYKAMWQPQLATLPNGFKLVYPNLLDGGGDNFKEGLLNAIKEHGVKRRYKRSYEWCAGHGIINYYLYDQGICNSMVFSDVYFAAIDNVKLSAKLNGIEDLVTAYQTGSVSEIPDTERFDLVVSNPPHCPESSLNATVDKDNLYYDNAKRLVVDEGWGVHRDFFANIKLKLADDADIFLWEVSDMDFFITLAKENGFTHAGTYDPKYERDPNNRILHFKYE